MTDVIVIDKLTKSFKGKTVLEDVNMRLQEGRIYGIVGDNGSGKTVLLKLICGFMKPDSGTVTVNGQGDRQRRGLPGEHGNYNRSARLPAQLQRHEKS